MRLRPPFRSSTGIEEQSVLMAKAEELVEPDDQVTFPVARHDVFSRLAAYHRARRESEVV